MGQTIIDTKHGGSGQSAYTDGQLLIGNTATGSQSKATLTAGAGITITNGNGTIQISGAAGDTLSLAVTQATHGFAVGDAIALNSSGVYIKADATTEATAEFVGIVSAVADTNNFTLTISGRITGLSGLTAGSVYFLSTTAGGKTTTAPTTVGNVQLPILRAISTTTGYVERMRGNVVSTSPSSLILTRTFFKTGEVATGTTTTPFDDTAPQNTEGNQFLSQQATLSSATNPVEVDVTIVLAQNFGAAKTLIVALFQDNTAGALAVAAQTASTSDGPVTITFRHKLTSGAGTTTPTFKVRAGMDAAGTLTLNGSGGTRAWAGLLASSITITEFKAF